MISMITISCFSGLKINIDTSIGSDFILRKHSFVLLMAK